MSHEIELKLTLPRKSLPALRRHPLVVAAARQGTAVTLDNTYFDTPGLELRARRVALRTRKAGRRLLQTVKCAAESTGGLSQRPEWEQPYAGHFDFTAVDAPKVRKLLERHADALQPVFTTRFRRETRLHAPGNGVQILLMIDHGEVIAGERHEPLCELELELVEGSAKDLVDLARQLAADLPLFPEDLSKAQRGFRLHLDEPPSARRADPSAIEPVQAPTEAFRQLAFGCLRQWQANVEGARNAADPEFLHQLRVALRRLRSLLDLFAPSLPSAFVQQWDARLDEIADAFAPIRDLDVLCDELFAPVLAAPYSVHGREADGLARLGDVLLEARVRARASLRADLDVAAQGRHLLDLTSDLLTLPGDLPGVTDQLPVFARHQLDRLHRKARRRLRAASQDTPETLHALRIAIKRLRYAVEFFAPLMPRKRAAAYLEALIQSQGTLGYINDVDVARARLCDWAHDDGALQIAAAFLCGWHGERHQRLGRRTLRQLRSLLASERPWMA